LLQALGLGEVLNGDFAGAHQMIFRSAFEISRKNKDLALPDQDVYI